MTWIDITGDARRLPRVLASQTLREAARRAHVARSHDDLGASGLPRAERQTIAACVSAADKCHC